MSLDNRTWFQKGLKDGIPIALGYFAVSFTLGITAKNAGFTALQAMLASFTLNASAGEFAGFTLIAAGAGYLEIAIMEFVANARYLLMSCALSQKLSPDTPLWQRLLIGYDVTDEIFGISISVPGRLNPYYTFGAIAIAVPGWSVGTYLGVLMGNILPCQCGKCLKRRTIWHVHRHHYPTCQKKQNCCRCGSRIYGSQLCFCKSACDFRYQLRHPYHYSDGRYLRSCRYLVSDKGGR